MKQWDIFLFPFREELPHPVVIISSDDRCLDPALKRPMTFRLLTAKSTALFLVALLVAAPGSYGAEKPIASVATIDLPEGFVAGIAAPPSLVKHPIMASLGTRGQLFVGDSSGTNLNKAGLEKALPHRILLLTDTDSDGVYDKAIVFADKMTFPQGGVWLDGSFYVASPPGIWRLTDTDGDGVADHREMIVGRFEYTGNAADVHGPFLHPNGRLSASLQVNDFTSRPGHAVCSGQEQVQSAQSESD